MFKYTDIGHDQGHLQSCPGIVGCDEVGRGCLAGPIMACAVRVTKTSIPFLKDLVADSKKMSASQRVVAYVQIVAAVPYCVSTRDSRLVDMFGIQRCNKDIFSEGIAALAQDGDLVFVDGTLPKLHPNMRSIKRGESVSAAIAAASIIAKVHRDHLMEALEGIYPGYGFARHKGYGTSAHQRALKSLGPCEIHRRTFIKNFVPAVAA